MSVETAASSPEEVLPIRRAHRGAELMVTVIGGASLLVGGVCCVASAKLLGDWANARRHGMIELWLIALALGVGTAVLCLLGGVRLILLRASGRTPVSLVAILFVLFYTVAANGVRELGMALAVVVLVAPLWTRKATTVLSDRYRDQVLRATPHLPLWGRLILVVVGLAAVGAGLLMVG